jgi:hypothetical protein
VDQELYVLAQSRARIHKERAMRRRELKWLWARLTEIAAMELRLDFSNDIGASGENLRNMLCCNNFSQVQEPPDADRVYAEAVCI